MRKRPTVVAAFPFIERIPAMLFPVQKSVKTEQGTCITASALFFGSPRTIPL